MGEVVAIKVKPTLNESLFVLFSAGALKRFK